MELSESPLSKLHDDDFYIQKQEAMVEGVEEDGKKILIEVFKYDNDCVDKEWLETNFSDTDDDEEETCEEELAEPYAYIEEIDHSNSLNAGKINIYNQTEEESNLLSNLSPLVSLSLQHNNLSTFDTKYNLKSINIDDTFCSILIEHNLAVAPFANPWPYNTVSENDIVKASLKAILGIESEIFIMDYEKFEFKLNEIDNRCALTNISPECLLNILIEIKDYSNEIITMRKLCNLLTSASFKCQTLESFGFSLLSSLHHLDERVMQCERSAQGLFPSCNGPAFTIMNMMYELSHTFKLYNQLYFICGRGFKKLYPIEVHFIFSILLCSLFIIN